MREGFSIESFPGVLYEKHDVMISRDTIYEWATRHTEFSDSKNIGEALQLKFYEKCANEAFDKGKTGFPAGPWVFTMKNKFKWRDDPSNEVNDDRPTLSDIMKSVSNESNDAKKKKRSSRKPKK